MKKYKALAISLLISLGTGAIAGLIVKDAAAKYNMMIKPMLAPPAIVFPIVWTLLYILMGVAAYLIYMSGKNGKDDALKLYAEQLVFNFIWPIIFFRTGWLLFAFIWILALWLLVALCTLNFSRIDKRATWLFVPYLVWTTFAVYLTLATYLLNR